MRDLVKNAQPHDTWRGHENIGPTAMYGSFLINVGSVYMLEWECGRGVSVCLWRPPSRQIPNVLRPMLINEFLFLYLSELVVLSVSLTFAGPQSHSLNRLFFITAGEFSLPVTGTFRLCSTDANSTFITVRAGHLRYSYTEHCSSWSHRHWSLWFFTRLLKVTAHFHVYTTYPHFLVLLKDF